MEELSPGWGQEETVLQTLPRPQVATCSSAGMPHSAAPGVGALSLGWSLIMAFALWFMQMVLLGWYAFCGTRLNLQLLLARQCCVCFVSN